MKNSDTKLSVESKSVIKKKPNTPLIYESDHIFKKHIGLININLRQLNYNQQKLFNAVLLLAKKQLEEDPERTKFTINSHAIREYCNQNEIRYSALDKNFKALQKTLIETVEIREDLDYSEFNSVQLLGKTTLRQRLSTKELLEFEFTMDDLVKDNLIAPKVYAQLDLKHLATYKSSYAYALDPVLRVNFNMTSFSKNISLNDYRDLVGIPPGTFEGRNDNLFVNTVKKPLAEIHEKSPELKDIFARVVKRGKCIVAIEFYREKEKQKVKTFKELDEMFRQYRFNDTEILKLLSEHDEKYIYEVLTYSYKQCLKKKNTPDEIKDLRAYALSCLKRKIELRKTEFEENIELQNKNEEIEDSNKKLIYMDQLETEHVALIEELCQSYYDNLLAPEKERLFEKVVENYGKQELFPLTWSLEDGFGSKITESQFFEYIVKRGYLEFEYTDFPTYVAHTYGLEVTTLNNRYFFTENKAKELQIKIERSNSVNESSSSKSEAVIIEHNESLPEEPDVGLNIDTETIKDDQSLSEELKSGLNDFLIEYKTEAALILLRNKGGKLYTEQYKQSEDETVDTIAERMAKDDTLFNFSVNDICEHMGLTLDDSSDLKLKKNDKVIAEGKTVLLKLYPLLPEDASSFAKLILR